MKKPDKGLQSFEDALRQSRKLLDALLTQFEDQLSAYRFGKGDGLKKIGVTLEQIAKTQIKAQKHKEAVDEHLNRLEGQKEDNALHLSEARAEIERRLARLRAARDS